MIDDVFEVRRREPNIQRMQYGAHGGHALVELQVAIVIPHEAANAIANFYAVCLQGMGYLAGPVPGLLQSLAMGAVGLHGDDFYLRVQYGASA